MQGGARSWVFPDQSGAEVRVCPVSGGMRDGHGRAALRTISGWGGDSALPQRPLREGSCGPASSKDALSLSVSHLDVAFLPLRSKPSNLLLAPPFPSFSPGSQLFPSVSLPSRAVEPRAAHLSLCTCFLAHDRVGSSTPHVEVVTTEESRAQGPEGTARPLAGLATLTAVSAAARQTEIWTGVLLLCEQQEALLGLGVPDVRRPTAPHLPVTALRHLAPT
ncbi:unnamed protein product [Rangifer tarandus platyrhynchus]|uniref:Uncharacterized protein n=1 Tax=Rangifer tarandus platyrhynchus TaxID=3082113 RepID=A0ABN8XU46_RANTA|nr:unnamed protein product [Rangifer tarandus platyrhynchus]